MGTSQNRLDPRELALAWLWSQPQTLTTDETVDLATLDLWRQGRLSGERSALVKRQLARDPRLMRMLEDLVGADELLQQWAAEEIPAKPSFRWWPWIHGPLRSLLSRLLDPLWAGGLIAAAASVLAVVILLPVAQGPDLGGQFEELYASLEIPADGQVLPWGPRIALRGRAQPPSTVETAPPESLAKQAFQTGISEGLDELAARVPGLEVSAARQLARKLPECVAADKGCQQQLELARGTGRWALAAHLQCRAPEASISPEASTTLAALQSAWLELSPEHPLGSALLALSNADDQCAAIRQLLRTWGR
jgi:hypothetical protein